MQTHILPFLLLSAVIASVPLCAANQTISIWPNGAPGPKNTTGPEQDMTTSKDDLIAGRRVIRLGNVGDPTITIYQPKHNNTGAAVVVFPGGGYHILAMDLEGTEVCQWLNSIGHASGICAFVGTRSMGPSAPADGIRPGGISRL